MSDISDKNRAGDPVNRDELIKKIQGVDDAALREVGKILGIALKHEAQLNKAVREEGVYVQYNQGHFSESNDVYIPEEVKKISIKDEKLTPDNTQEAVTAEKHLDFNAHNEPPVISPERLDDLNKAMREISFDLKNITPELKESLFISRSDSMLKDIDVLIADLNTVPETDWPEKKEGKEVYIEKLQDLKGRGAELQRKYFSFVDLITLSGLLDETKEQPEVVLVKPVSENVPKIELTHDSIAVVAPPVIAEKITAETPPPLPTIKKVIERKPPLADEIIKPAVEISEEPPMPEKSIDEFDWDSIGQKDVDDGKKLLDQARTDFAKVKNDFESRDSFISRVKKMISGAKYEDKEIAYNEAKEKYESAKAQYVGLELFRGVEEQNRMIDAQVAEKIRREKKPENILEFIISGYERMGRMNLGNTKWGREQMAKQGKLGKTFIRLASLRSVANTGLVGGSIATGGVIAGIFGAVGVGHMTYEALKAREYSKEEDDGLLQELSSFTISLLDIDSLVDIKKAILERCKLDGVTLENSPHKDLSDKIDERLKEELENGDKAQFKNLALSEFIKGEDIVEEARISDRIKFKSKILGTHGKVGLVAGLTFFVAGQICDVNDVKKYVQSEFDRPDNVHELKVEQPKDIMLADKDDVSMPEETSDDVTTEQIEDELTRVEIQKGESLVEVIKRDFQRHPKRLMVYSNRAWPIREIVEDHNGDLDKLTTEEKNQIAELAHLNTFGQHGLRARQGGAVFVFDEEEGKYKVGSIYRDRELKNIFGREVPKSAMFVNPGQTLAAVVEADVKPKVKKGREKIPTDAHLSKMYPGPFPSELSNIGVVKLAKAPDLSVIHSIDLGDIPTTKPAEALPVSATVESKISETLPDTKESVSPKVSLEEFRSAEAKYKSFREPIVGRMKDLLNTKKIEPIPFGDDVDNKMTMEFILDTKASLEKSAGLDRIEDADFIKAVFSSESKLSEAQKIAAVEDRVFKFLPPEAEVLLAVPQKGEMAVVEEKGLHAIQFFESSTGKKFFLYHPDYIFLKGENNEILIKKGEELYVAQPFIDKKGRLQLNPKVKKR